METLNILFEITVYSGVIFIATMLLKTCFKDKMSPLLHYAVWFVLVLRLMLPATIASPVRLFVIPVEPQIPIGMVVQPDAYQPVTTSGINTEDIADTQPQAEAVSPVHNETPVTHENAGQLLSLSLPQVLTLAWLAGAGVCLSYLAFLYASLRRKIRRNAARPSKRLIELFEEAKSEMGIKANIKLVCQYEYGTPSLLFPKTILMPADALISMNDEQTMFALRHELAHYRRGDHIVSILLSLLNAVYWFNPFVWAAFGQMRRDMETACDGAVVKTLCAAAKSRYAMLIVSLSAQPAHRQLALGMSHLGLRKAAEQRVKGIYMKGKSRMSTKLITVLLAAALLFTCFTTACQPISESTYMVNENNNQQASGAPSLDIPVKVSEKVNSGENYPINIDADVIALNIAEYPIYSYVPCSFTQSEVDKAIAYFFNDSPLYARDFIKSKSMIVDELAQFRADLQKMDGSNPDDIEGCQAAIKELEEEYPNAPEKPIRTQITSKLTVSADADYEALDATVDLEYDELSTISVCNRSKAHFMNVNLDKSRAYNSSILLAGKNPEGQKMTPDEAKRQAEKALSDMGIEDMIAVKVEAGMTEDQSKQGYVVTFHREVNGVSVAYNNRLAMNPRKWTGEDITICLDDKGISHFDWFHKGQAQEELTANAQLKSFDEIMDIARQQLRDNYTSSADIGSIALEYTCDPDNCILVPAWNFYNESDYSDLSSHRVLSINAVDGSVIG